MRKDNLINKYIEVIEEEFYYIDSNINFAINNINDTLQNYESEIDAFGSSNQIQHLRWIRFHAIQNIEQIQMHLDHIVRWSKVIGNIK